MTDQLAFNLLLGLKIAPIHVSRLLTMSAFPVVCWFP